MFTFQVDTEAMVILGMLQQEPGAAVWLFTCSAGIGGWLLFTCCDREERIGLGGILTEKLIEHHQQYPDYILGIAVWINQRI